MTRLALVLLLAGAALAEPAFDGGPALDAAIDGAIHDGLIPGAVLLIGHNGAIVYRKAYGSRALIPAREPMTVDTIFDAASLTKVIATTPCIMRLFEEGKIRLSDPVTRYLPEFQGGHSGITVRDLLTHFSGEPPDLILRPPWRGYETGIEKALADPPDAPPGVRFVYSDINFILLGEIVHRLSGKPLNEFAREVVFQPLGMNDTMFLPPVALRPRIAPTEIDPDTGAPLRGVVHDETSRFMGGVAGHAGLFLTADDMGRFAEMLLGLGERDGVRLFSPLTVRKFTTPETPAGQPILRGFGWDIDSPFSGNRGELFPLGSFG
ncbi:MAG: serine hydrolase domain-containing protein, partial [Bryobacteraceae bacterium]